MHSPEVNCFLSCSFKPEDFELNNLILTISKALDIRCSNVDRGFSDIPSEVARQQIDNCQIFIAIAVKRDRINDTTWQMPPAVHDEISMAYALKKDILILKETDVTISGFLAGYCTFFEFDRSLICDNGVLEKIISSIHRIKMKAVRSHDLVPRQDATGFYAENISLLVELVHYNKTYYWKYNSTRSLRFTDKFTGKLKNAAWAIVKPESALERISWDANIYDCSKPFKLVTEIEKDLPECLELSVGLDPKPKDNDTATLSFEFKSKHLNPVFKTDLPENSGVKLGNATFECFDGFIPIQRTKNYKGQFRFPREYNIRSENIFPFVASFSSGIDYLVESEMERMKVTVEDFGGVVIVTMATQSPLEGHFYGIAWNTTM